MTLEEIRAKSGSVSVAEFFGKLYQVRDTINLMHLATKSYAKHIALNDFYEEILELTDTLVESYQGNYGLISFKIPESKVAEPISYLKEFDDYIQKYRNIFKRSYHQNILDEINALTNQTLYKLINLE